MKAEQAFCDQALQVNEPSGSCALVALFVNDYLYIANVGDSRALLSSNKGGVITPLSEDHKPDLPSERQRIEKAGG
jgi:protein phosphatase 2C family protein 2/3